MKKSEMKQDVTTYVWSTRSGHRSVVMAGVLACATAIIGSSFSYADSSPESVRTQTLKLSGAVAVISGPKLTKDQGCLTYWHDVSTTASWQAFATEPCRVAVDVIAAVEPSFGGSSYELRVGNQTLSGKLTDTNNWENYRHFSLGSIDVEAGELQVQLKPTQVPNGVFGNIKAVHLRGEHLTYRNPRWKPDISGPIKVFSTAQHNGHRLSEEDSLQPQEITSNSTTTVVVNPAKRYQKIEGFGGAFTESAGIVFSQLRPAQQREVLEAYFSKDKGHGYRLCRTHINSCDFSSGNYAYTEVDGDVGLEHFSIQHDRKYLIPLIRAAQSAAGDERIKILATPWSPPAWMKSNGTMTDGGKLKPEYRDAWARYYCRYIEEYAKESIPIWGLTIQNEPAAVQSWESCNYTAEEERDFVRDHLGPTLHRRGLEHVKLVVWDHNRDLLFDRVKTVFDDPEASKFVWGAGFHWYVTDDFHHVRMVRDFYPDKKLLFTEGCLEGAPQEGDWSGGERYARSIINDLNNGASGWIDWNILLNAEGGPNHVGNFCSAPIIADLAQDRLIYNSSYYYLGHFSRFIRPGAHRILIANTGSEILTTAFQNQDGSVVIVLLNEQEYPVRYALKMDDLQSESICLAHSITTLIIEQAALTAKVPRQQRSLPH